MFCIYIDIPSKSTLRRDHNAKTTETKTLVVDTALIKSVAQSLLVLLVLLAPVKQDGKRHKKYPKQANITALSNTCFVIDEFHAFINKNAYTKLSQYTVSKQKKITKLLDKAVFKVINAENIPKNTQIINSYFIDEIKNLSTNMAYKKRWLVVQAYNDQIKDFVARQLPTIQ